MTPASRARLLEDTWLSVASRLGALHRPVVVCEGQRVEGVSRCVLFVREMGREDDAYVWQRTPCSAVSQAFMQTQHFCPGNTP